MKYAATRFLNGVETVIVVLPLSLVPGFDPENPPQANTYGVADDVEVGWVKQSDGSFLAPDPVVTIPSRCTHRQGELALLEWNINSLDIIAAAIAAIPDTLTRKKAEVEYRADTWERSNPFLQTMWANLGGSPEELDDLFRLAVTL